VTGDDEDEEPALGVHLVLDVNEEAPDKLNEKSDANRAENPA
jgi:hypothetical protein